MLWFLDMISINVDNWVVWLLINMWVMENDDIKEGFICLICMKDLGNVLVL